MRESILPALLAGALLTPAGAALAAANASATIDWGSFSVKSISLDPLGKLPVFEWTDEGGLSYAEAATNYPWLPRTSDPHSAADFSTTLSSVVSTAHAQASGFRDVLTVMAHASSEASGYLFEADNDAYGEAWNSGKFKLTGAGIALITLPYSISVSAGGACSGAVCDYSRAEVYIVGRYDSADGTSSGSATSRKLLENNDPAFSGTFSVVIIITPSSLYGSF